MSTIGYSELAQSLKEAASDMEAAEAHGCLSGALCGQSPYPPAEWASEVLPDAAPGGLDPGLLDLLATVHRETLESLQGDEMTFAPLLPDDAGSLAARVEALAAWCGGFLYGLGRAGSMAQLAGDVDEAVRDLSEIARAGVDEDEPDEEAEAEYTELVEFVRASVQLVFEELAALRAQAASASGRKH